MTDEGERRERRDSLEDRGERMEEKLEEKMEEFRGEARERHPELEGGGKRQTGPTDPGERSEKDHEGGETTVRVEDRGPERDQAHEHPGEGEATERSGPEPEPDRGHTEPHDEPEPQYRADEASERTSAGPEGSYAEIEREEAELEGFRVEVGENHPEEPAGEKLELSQGKTVEADSARQDNHEDRPDGLRDAAEAEARRDGREPQGDREDARPVERAGQPEPGVERPKIHREEDQHEAQQEKEQLHDDGRQEKDHDPDLGEPSENGKQLEKVETDQDSRPKPIEAGENSDPEISRHENPPVEAGADEAKDEPPVREQGVQEIPKSDNVEGADREAKTEDVRGVNVVPADIEVMPQSSPETENHNKKQAEPSDYVAVENVLGSLNTEKTEVKAPDATSRQESFSSVPQEKRQDVEIPTSADGKQVSIQPEPFERIELPGYIASFEATAIRRPEDGRTAFEINVESLEKQSGVTFEKGKVYTVSGSIEYGFDFRKLYSAGESEKMVVFAPSRFADSIETGERYSVNITSVQEISRTDRHLGVFYENAYMDGKNGSIRFDILRTSFEKRTGIQFEEGKTYKITGTIGDITDFQLMRSRSEGKHLYVSPPPETRDMFALGQKYELKVLSVEERRTYRVRSTPDGGRLQLQKHALESVGIELERVKGRAEQDRIVELTMRNLSHPGEAEERLYSRVNPTEGAVLNFGRGVRAKEGDMYELIRARFYERENFLKDFAAHRGKETQNVALKMDGRKLAMEVDGRKFEFSEHRMDVNALRVFMKARTEAFKYDLHFIYDAAEGTITAKTVRGRTIESFSASETHGLEVKYAPRDKEVAAIAEPRSPQEAKWEMPRYLESVKLLGENQGIESPHWFEVDEALHRYILDTRNSKEYSKRPELGTIGENLGSAVLTKLDWTEVERHPFETRRGPGPEWYKHGTDILFREPGTDRLYLFEFRNWQNSRVAMDKTVDVVLGRRDREEMHRKWGKISGAYIAIVELDKRSTIGELHIRRVW